MTSSRIAVALGIAVLSVFVIAVFLGGNEDLQNLVMVLVAMVLLIVAGSALYGRRSHYGQASARTRPAQLAHDQAADMAAEARRATADAARRGERYCPLDPALRDSPQHQPPAGA